ncbi:MAG: hypothetical protein N3E45_06670 [Oscillatoriaceae bacterium SKW80]|nr:hypothetical protein [Oscillatoriaceae bacterium SKYG93]MCX8120500.1 hypothetical protein [Oscillatoriaceae bacterium SKW80]MDW8452738.1 hypothetical protein [Oscillatoriaceae cyanobacterium SKYGB_i_bin93]HIK27192.1 hypothetical protein [Oscillatoriaceae cyanobacterium M7585_C2015_266]
MAIDDIPLLKLNIDSVAEDYIRLPILSLLGLMGIGPGIMMGGLELNEQGKKPSPKPSSMRL